jgi:hypothetical protein
MSAERISLGWLVRLSLSRLDSSCMHYALGKATTCTRIQQIIITLARLDNQANLRRQLVLKIHTQQRLYGCSFAAAAAVASERQLFSGAAKLAEKLFASASRTFEMLLLPQAGKVERLMDRFILSGRKKSFIFADRVRKLLLMAGARNCEVMQLARRGRCAWCITSSATIVRVPHFPRSRCSHKGALSH